LSVNLARLCRVRINVGVSLGAGLVERVGWRGARVARAAGCSLGCDAFAPLAFRRGWGSSVGSAREGSSDIPAMRLTRLIECMCDRVGVTRQGFDVWRTRPLRRGPAQLGARRVATNCQRKRVSFKTAARPSFSEARATWG